MVLFFLGGGGGGGAFVVGINGDGLTEAILMDTCSVSFYGESGKLSCVCHRLPRLICFSAHGTVHLSIKMYCHHCEHCFICLP